MKSAILMALVLGLAGCASGLNATRPAALPGDVQANPDSYVVVAVRNESLPVASRAGSTPRGYDGAASYSTSSAALALIESIAHDYGLHEVAGWPIDALHVHCVVFRRPLEGDRAELLERLAHDPRVALAQPLNTFQTATAAFNDPYAKLQTSLDALGIAEAHRWSMGAGVRIAVIDTGVNSSHPDLRGRVVERRNFVDGDMAGFEGDLHGTQVAGIIAAVANNGEGIVGIAPRADILALKACWHSPVSGGAVCNSFTLAQALVAAVDSRADIVNLSLAGPSDPLLSELVERGIARGMIYVGSVPPGGRRDGFPVGIAGVIAADSSAPAARPASVLYAPGNNVLTLTPGGHYDFASGSSLAAAHVSGALALLIARQPHIAAATLDQLLSKTSTAVPSDAGPVDTISACEALAALLSRASCSALAASESTADPDMKRTAAARSH
ncbi:MAG TPA: S8 family serine peptidase [Steroidobacteraceae bacterium]|nr:S8 family serine peptidase [Steroidobacteraceae bacterium]